MFFKDEKAVIEKELHILGMHRTSLLHPQMIGRRKKERNKECGLQHQIIPHATELHEAGIKFGKSPTNSLNDVSFKEGVLKLPCLVLDDDTETILLNVMAFEKLHLEAGSEVTSFVVLMDNLIDVDKDVALLSSNNVIVNALGNDASAADLFGLLAKEAALDLDSHICDVLYSVNQHCSQAWHRWCASFKPDYLQHKWALISVLAATFGFAIIIVQLAYQNADYNRRN